MSTEATAPIQDEKPPEAGAIIHAAALDYMAANLEQMRLELQRIQVTLVTTLTKVLEVQVQQLQILVDFERTAETTLH